MDAESLDSMDNILVRLNNDCIIHVFEYLPLYDLSNVADVCRAFQSNALSVFKRRHTILDSDELLVERDSDNESRDDRNDTSSDSLSTISGSDIEWNNKHTRYKPAKERRVRHFHMETVERLFRNFGALIKTIDLTAKYECQLDGILELMAIHCTHQGAQLTKLIMRDVDIAPDLIPRIQPLFDRLTSLDVIGGSFYPFYIGTELTELKLEDAYLDAVFTHQFQKLHSIYLSDVEGSSVEMFVSFLEMATQVKRLVIAGRMRANLSSLVWFPPQLEEIEVDTYVDEEQEFMSLGQLQNLRVLTLNCLEMPMTRLFDDLRKLPIEELSLKNFTLASSIAGFSKVKKLSLVYGGWTHDVQLSTIIKEMPLLEQLYLEDFRDLTIDVIKSAIANAPKLSKFAVNFEYMEITFGTSDYIDIGQLVQKRSDMVKLSLELVGAEIKVNFSQNVVEQYKLWLEVTSISFMDVQQVNIVDYYDFSDDSESSDDDESSDVSYS